MSSPIPHTLVVLIGPTGVGKSAVGVRLAMRWGASIVSADSRQVFREMRVGVAAPPEADQAWVPHHLVGHRSLRERYSCGQYEGEALACLQRLFQQARIALLVGGSMLYVQALCQGVDDFPPPDEALRARLNQRLKEDGVEPLAHELQQLDPVACQRIDLANGARVLRALEVSLQTGRPYSSFLTRVEKPRPFRIITVGLRMPFPDLEKRIYARVDAMLQEGLLDEVKALEPYWHLPALRTVGYREFFDYLRGHDSLENAIHQMKIHTRQYAKRQLTWWARDPNIRWVDSTFDAARTARAVANLVENSL